MNKNIDLHLDDVRDNLRGQCGHYESAAELLADVTKAVFWAGVEADPFSEGEGFNSLDVWGMFASACKIDRYANYSRDYLATANEGIITACYVVIKQSGDFIYVCGCEPVGMYESMYEGTCLIIEVRVNKDGEIIATCL